MPMGGPRGPGGFGHGPGGHRGPGGPGPFGHRPGGFRHGPRGFGPPPPPPGRFRPRHWGFGPPPPPPPRRGFGYRGGCLGCGGFMLTIIAAIVGIVAAILFLF